MESRRVVGSLAFGWGFAEGVLFFIIPDVLLTYVAVRRGVHRGLAAAGWAVAGAVVGGLIAFAWGSADAASARATMAVLPAVDHEMIATVERQVAEHGPQTLVTAPWSGRPYKLYAAAAGAVGASPLTLAVWTVPGRLWRFAALVLLSGTVATQARQRVRGLPQWVPLAVWATCWLAIYAVFWSR